MVFLTLKVILHGAENDSKYRDVAPLNTDVFETRTVTGRRMHLLLARFDRNQSIEKPLFYKHENFELNAIDENFVKEQATSGCRSCLKNVFA